MGMFTPPSDPLDQEAPVPYLTAFGADGEPVNACEHSPTFTHSPIDA